MLARHSAAKLSLHFATVLANVMAALLFNVPLDLTRASSQLMVARIDPFIQALMCDLQVNLPNSRKLEMEADTIGWRSWAC